MADAVILTSFAGGELSPTMFSRVDLAKYQVGAQLIRNFFVDYRGGVSFRPGTQFVVAAATNTLNAVRIIPFIVSQDQAYVIELTPTAFRVIYNGAVIDSGTTPFTADELFDVKYIQSADVMTLTHPSHLPQKLSRTAETVFTWAEESIGPTIEDPINLAATATVAGSLIYSYVITALTEDGQESLPSSSDAVASAALDPTHATPKTVALVWEPDTSNPASELASYYNVYKFGPVPNTQPLPTTYGYIGQTRTGQFTDTNIAPDFARTPPNWRDPFRPGQIIAIEVTAGGTGYEPFTPLTITGDGAGASAFAVANPSGVVTGVVIQTSGADYTTATVSIAGTGTGATFTAEIDENNYYPSCVSYFQQRRVYAGSLAAPTLLEFSQVGAYTNFDFSTALLDSDAISVGLAAREVNVVKHLVPMSTGLIVFTTGSAYLVNGGSDTAPITPTNISTLPQAGTGAGDLPPIVVNYNVLFNQAQGAIVRDLAFNFNTQSYYGTDRSMLANHLFKGHRLVDWCFSEEPYKLLWVVREDGILLSMSYVPDQEVYGWARHDTQGLFKSVCVIPENGVDMVYCVVARHVDTGSGPCWKNYIEKFIYDEECCIYESWFLDSAVSLTHSVPESDLYITDEGNDVVTLTSYDPCDTDPGTGPFGGGAEYIMEAHENYPADFAADIDGGSVPWNGATSQNYFALGVDRANRRFIYSVCWQPVNGSIPNPYAYQLRDGLGNTITNGGTFNQRFFLNFYIVTKDMDTGVVTKYFTHDPDNIVPTSVFGVANIRRTVSATANFIQAPHLVVPDGDDAGDVWVHHASSSTPSDLAPCSINVFREADSYTQQIYPLYATVSGFDHMEIVGLGPDWFLCMESDTSYLAESKNWIAISPRETTVDEVNSGYKQIYAAFEMPVGVNNPGGNTVGTFWPRWCMASNGDCYIFGFEQLAGPGYGWQYKLLKFTLPTSAPYGGPVVGGGVTDITPWTSTTGPNWYIGTYGPRVANFQDDPGWQQFIWRNQAAGTLICVSFQTWIYTGVFGAGYQSMSGADVTYVNLASPSTWETHQRFIGPFAKADWTQTSDINEAAWSLVEIHDVDADLPMHSYDFPGVDYSTKWFQFIWRSVSGGVVDADTTNHITLERWRFEVGSPPALVTRYDEQGWRDAYPAYATAIANNNVVYRSTATKSNGVPAEMLHWDTDTNSFWGSGGGSGGQSTPNNFFLFDTDFDQRQPNAGVVASPLLRLRVAGEDEVAVGDVLHINCGQIRVDTIVSASEATGTILADVDLSVPGDPDGTLLPVIEGDWTVTTPTSTITGLSHLEGKEVWALADGAVYGPLTVAAGQVEIEDAGDPVEVATAVVGLKYQGQFQTLRLDVGDPTIQGKRKFIPAVTLRVNCCAGLKAGTSWDYNQFTVPVNDDLQDMTVTVGEFVTLCEGDFRILVDASWDRGGYITIQQDWPVPATITGLIPEVTVGDSMG